VVGVVHESGGHATRDKIPSTLSDFQLKKVLLFEIHRTVVANSRDIENHVLDTYIRSTL
jgi:hypothetical protein